MLNIAQLHAYHGNSHVLHGVDMQVRPGEIVALLGRNGSGRSTTAKAIMGLVRSTGSVQWKGQPIQGKQPFEIAQLGVGYVPETRDIFPTLTVHQNLLLGEKNALVASGRQRWRLDDAYALFPPLKQRQHTPGGVLSGGEQQMLSLCRTLMGNPELVIVDEPTEGLAPARVQEVAQTLQTLRQRGVSVLLIEQKRHMALRISDRVLVMGRGRVVFQGTPDELLRHPDVCQEWLGV
jgi:branched-chain amino acid transport system ATP-binding protein